MMFEMSKNYDKSLVKARREVFGPIEGEESIKAFIGSFLSEMKSQGWGDIALATFDTEKGVFEVDVKDNPFTPQCDSRGHLTQCLFYRGVTLGVLSELLNQELRLSEHLCGLDEKKPCLISMRSQ